MNKLLAADTPIAPPGGFKGFGPLGEPEGSGITTFSTFISNTIGIMTIIAIIWFVFTFITGAIGIIASGGDKGALETAKKKITSGLIGLVVVIAATFVIDLIGLLLGFDSGSFGILNINNLFYSITGMGGIGGGATSGGTGGMGGGINPR